MFFHMDSDKLISLVHDQPSIWDKNSSKYADNNARAKSWMEVGKEMYEEFEQLEEQEKKKKIAELKDKWRHIRDNYVRYFNGGSSGDAAPKRKKYIYADALEFLRSSVEKRSTSGNFEQSEQQSSVDAPPLQENDPEGDHWDNSEGAEPQPSLSTSFRKPARKKKPLVTTPFQTLLLQKLDAPISFSAEPEDPDKAYLFSLLPYYKKLSDEDKLDFQSTVLDFLRSRTRKTSAKYPSSQSTFPQTSSYEYQYLLHPCMGQHSYSSSSSSRTPSPSNVQFPDDPMQL